MSVIDVEQKRVAAEVAVLEQLPSISPSKSPVILAGPWTREAKNIMYQRGMRILAEKIVHSASKRIWTPLEMGKGTKEEAKERAGNLSEGTRTSLIAAFKIEARVADYTGYGLETIREDGLAGARIVINWGGEESRHPIALGQALIDSGIITERQRLDMEEEALSERWDYSRHPGISTRFGPKVFGRAQELATIRNDQVIIRYVTEEYALTDEEKEMVRVRGYAFGILHALKLVAGDEGGHYADYGDMLKWGARFYPEEVFDAMIATQRGFTMPMEGLLKESQETKSFLFPGREGIVMLTGSIDSIAKSVGFRGRKVPAVAMNNLTTFQVQEPSIIRFDQDGNIIPVDNYTDILASLTT